MEDSTPRESRRITCGGKEYIERCAEILIRLFVDDPVMMWLMCDTGAPGSQEMHRARYGFFSAIFRAAAMNKGRFIEINDFASCALVMPPGEKADNPWTMIQAGIIPALWTVGFGGMKRVLFEYADTCHHMLPKAFNKEEQENHWYIIIIGTELDRRRKGLASDILGYIKDLARKDGRPVWIESTTETSRDLYVKNGFTELDDVVVLGQGKVGSDGIPKKNGEGVTIRCLYWRP
ncbi:putative increased recombination centers protein 11 [Rhypophila decipiens]